MSQDVVTEMMAAAAREIEQNRQELAVLRARDSAFRLVERLVYGPPRPEGASEDIVWKLRREIDRRIAEAKQESEFRREDDSPARNKVGFRKKSDQASKD